MQKINFIAFLATGICAQAFGNSIDFVWTAINPPGQLQIPSDLSIFFEYSGGTIVNGVFTPTGLTDSSWGQPGLFTPVFLTDTSYGPAFQVEGPIEPLSLETVFSASREWAYQGQTETVSEFDTGPPTVYDLTGVWTVTGLSLPDATNSAMLLAAALGALGLFHTFGRTRPAQS